MRSQIDQLDAYRGDPENDRGSDIEIIKDTTNPSTSLHVPPPVSASTVRSGNGCFTLGSYQGVRTIQKILEREARDPAFTGFCARLSVVVKGLNPMDAIIIDESHHVCLVSLIKLMSHASLESLSSRYPNTDSSEVVTNRWLIGVPRKTFCAVTRNFGGVRDMILPLRISHEAECLFDSSSFLHVRWARVRTCSH